MKIDAHQHFWRYDPAQYGWIDSSMAKLQRDFGPADLESVQQGCGIDASIAVQARQTVEETRWLLELADQHPRIAAVVGWVPLAAPNIADVLRELEHPRLKGVRHVVQEEADPEFLLRPAFAAGVQVATALRKTYDLLIRAHQLPTSIEFADSHPRLTIVLDHIAKPVVSGPPPAEWRRHIRELARRPHVFCKFSGVVTEVAQVSLGPELVQPYFEVVLEAFGPRRLMFGSDWPVCLIRAEYATWFEWVRQFTAQLSTDEAAWIWGRTAASAYRLD